MLPDARWRPAPPDLALAPAEVHVWRIHLDPPPARVASLTALLDATERARADRFVLAEHGRRFAVGRGALRSILGRFLGIPAAGVAFQYGPQGKPALDQSQHASPVHFNLTNSGELALCAVAIGRELGVDVEIVRPIASLGAIAERFFSPSERQTLASVRSADQTEAFYRCWTRKEAYIKARGEGLRIPLDAFDVTLGADEPARLIATRHDPADARRWTLRAIDPGPGYVGALAVEGAGWSVALWDWS